MTGSSQLITRVATALVVVTAAPADAEPGARELATRSTTLSFSPELSTLPSITANLGFDAWLRVVRLGGLSITPRLGGFVGGSLSAGGAIYGMHVGIGAGWSFALGRRSVLTPSAGYDLFVLGDVRFMWIHRYIVEATWSVLVYPHVVVEAFAGVGTASVSGTSDVALTAGPRIGLVF
jgi:hypothetical protein